MTNAVNIDNFMEGVDCKEFRRIATCLKIEEYFNDLLASQSSFHISEYIKNMSNLNVQVGECLTKLNTYYNLYWNHDNSNGITSEFKKAILEVAKINNLFDDSIDHIFIQLDKWFEGVEIIKKVDINESSLPFILKLLRDNKKRLNLDYYQKFVEISKIVLPKEKDKKGNEQLTLSFEIIEEYNKPKYKFLTNN